ncbi:MAG: Jag N-terminal domain-containing protein, partial [Chloroflexota bacterium]
MTSENSIVTTGATVEEAISKGLKQLGVQPSQVIVEVLDEPSRGLFGIGTKQARVRLQRLVPTTRQTPTPANPPVTQNPPKPQPSPVSDEVPTPQSESKPAQVASSEDGGVEVAEAPEEEVVAPVAVQPVTPEPQQIYHGDDDDDFFDDDGSFGEDVEDITPRPRGAEVTSPPEPTALPTRSEPTVATDDHVEPAEAEEPHTDDAAETDEDESDGMRVKRRRRNIQKADHRSNAEGRRGRRRGRARQEEQEEDEKPSQEKA